MSAADWNSVIDHFFGAFGLFIFVVFLGLGMLGFFTKD